MYVPAHFALDERACLDALANMGAADLVTTGPDGPDATYLPLEFRPASTTTDAAERAAGASTDPPRALDTRPIGSLVGHLARNNPQAKPPADERALVIVHAGDHYVSPAPMPSVREHGKVVPTWDYVTVHAFGRLVIHDDPAWLRAHLNALTDKHEQRWALPGEPTWSTGQAPAEYLERMMRAIVGIEVVIERLVGKAKLSQNKAPADVEAEITALEARGMGDMADLKRRVSLPAAQRRADLLHDVGQRRAFRISTRPDLPPGPESPDGDQ